MTASVELFSPFEALKRPLTISARDVKPGQALGDATPLAWWKCDEPSGAALNNATGNKYAGAIMGPPTRAQGEPAHPNAVEFDGRKNWVECSGTSDIDFGKGVSVAVWFKVRPSDQSPQTVVAKGDSWKLQRLGDKGTIEFTLMGPLLAKPAKGMATVTSKRKIDDGLWHQVVATYDGARVAMFLDGVQEESKPATGTLQATSALVTLGGNGASRGRMFNGWMHDVRVYDHGLSDQVIKSLYTPQNVQSASTR